MRVRNLSGWGTVAAAMVVALGACAHRTSRPAEAASAATSARVAVLHRVVLPGRFEGRPVTVRTPAGYDGASPMPLVLALAGWGEESVLDFVAEQRLDALADRKNFLLVAAEGRVSRGAHYWKATDACCDFDHAGADEDVAYLVAVLDGVEGRFTIDERRVFVVGYSAGGAMAHRLACDASTRIAAVVSRAGAVWNDASRCRPEVAVAIVEAHGTADEVVRYEGGGPARPGAGLYPSARATVATWAANNGCSGPLETTADTYAFDAEDPSRVTRVARYAGCPVGGDVELWTLEGTPHFTELLPAWNEQLWTFLATHPKPPPATSRSRAPRRSP